MSRLTIVIMWVIMLYHSPCIHHVSLTQLGLNRMYIPISSESYVTRAPPPTRKDVGRVNVRRAKKILLGNSGTASKYEDLSVPTNSLVFLRSFRNISSDASSSFPSLLEPQSWGLNYTYYFIFRVDSIEASAASYFFCMFFRDYEVCS